MPITTVRIYSHVWSYSTWPPVSCGPQGRRWSQTAPSFSCNLSAGPGKTNFQDFHINVYYVLKDFYKSKKGNFDHMKS
jgi:hypothetical protein